MSFEQKIRNDLERDKFNINYHLNTSLEAEGISVSEDLIRRTMDAIRLNEVQASDTVKEDKVPVRPYYLRNARALVSLAAAALLLFVGLSALRNFSNLGMKKEMAKPENQVKYDATGNTSMAEREESDDLATYKIAEGGEEAALKADSLPNMKEDTADTDAGIDDTKVSVAREVSGAEDIKDEKTQALDMLAAPNTDDKTDEAPARDNIAASMVYPLTFTDIAVAEAADVKEIRLTSKSGADMDIMTAKEDIETFYTVMTRHFFMEYTEEDADILYIVKITSEDMEEQINIGEVALTVDITHDGITSYSVYRVADHPMLLKDLGDLLGD